jgi:predicted permease
MIQDLRHSLRAITRAKATTAVLLLSLALGTGANAAVYGVLDAFMRRGPAGVLDASTLIEIYTTELSGAPYGQSSYADFESIRLGASSLSAVAAIDDGAVENIQVDEFGVSPRIASVSEEFFAALQAQPHAGRLLGPGNANGDLPPAVVSGDLAARMGGAEGAVGKALTIRDRTYVIVGVAPPEFRGLRSNRESDVWIPLTAPASRRGDRRLSLIARLRPNADIEDAQTDLQRISKDLAERFPDTNRGTTVDPETPRLISARSYSPLDPVGRTQVIVIAVIIAGASMLLLASACFNVGNLLLSWAVARRHEIAIKMALGAARPRLVRQLLLETQCLSLAGGALGVLFAIWTADAIPALFMAEQAELLDTRINARILLLTVGVACVSGAVFGIAPALHGTGSQAVTALRADAGGVSEQHAGRRLRAVLVTSQIALSTVLLLATGLLVMSLTRALEGDRASAVKNVAVVSLELPGRFVNTVAGIQFRNRMLETVPKLAGVESVGWVSTLPLGRGNRLPFQLEGKSAAVTDTLEFETNVVSPDYFRALRLKCVEGRLFDDTDHALAPPVAVVDELLARRYFGATAVGRHLIGQRGARVEIVGVIQGGTYRTLQQTPQPTVYFSSVQDYLFRGHLLVRTVGDPATMLEAIEKATEAVGEGENILAVTTLERYLSESLTIDRLTTTLVGLCGLIALAMSTIGVYGTMADAVQRRTREIGLRLALGAGRVQVAKLILVEAVYLAVVGIAVGVAGAFAIGRLAHAFLSIAPSINLASIASAVAALAAAMALAAVVPLRRALRVSPNLALRAE